MENNKAEGFFALLILLAWITHVVNTIITMNWWLLIIGVLIFPVGAINGVLVWLTAIIG